MRGRNRYGHVGDGCSGLIWGGLVVMRSDKRGSVNPGLLKAGGVVLAVLIVGATGVVLYHDRQTQAAYQEWARAENKKVFDQATQQRLSDQQLLSLERQLNDSFYQRLQDQLPVRVLVVGDGYGAGMGASQAARSWAQRLKASLAMKNGVTVELTNVSLSEQNGGFGAWASLRQQPDGAATAMLAEMVGDGRAEVSKDGTISAEGWNNTMSHAFRKDEYDLAIVSLGMTDDPSQFPTWYEAVLRGLREKYRQCSVISLLSSQALTSPELGFADENMEALRTISKQYHADVVNVGMEMLDPEGAGKGATTSEIAQKAVAMAAGSEADGAVASATEEAGDADGQVKAAQAAIQKYTVEGLYLNDAGQGFLADTLQKFIDQKVANAQGYTADEVPLLDPAVEALDEFHYIPVAELNRLNDYTYALGKNQMRLADDSSNSATEDTAGGAGTTGAAGDIGTGATSAAGGLASAAGATGATGGAATTGTGATGAAATGTGAAGGAGTAGGKKSGSIVRHSEHVAGDFFRGIVGVDYMLASGDNDLYIATGDGTKPFGRITANNPYSSSTRSVAPVNDHFSADRDGNLIISFGTKEQAAGLQGILFGGDLELPAALDDFKTVAYVGPTDENGKRLLLDEDGRIAETTAEPAPETTKAAQKPTRTTSTQKPGAAGAANLAGGAAGKAQDGAAQSTNGSGTDHTKGSKSSDGADKPKSEQAADKNHSAASTGTETTGAQDGTPKSSTHTGDGNTRESAASTEAGTAASSTAAESTTEADKPHGTIPGVVEIPADGPRETSEGKHVLTEEERLAILDRIKTSEAANG